MHCFNHPDTSAVGVCKHCGKAICRECITDLGFGLACKNLHEKDVEDVHLLVVRNVALQKKGDKGFTKYACVFLFGAPGLLFLLQGIFEGNDKFLIALGVVFIILAVMSLKMVSAKVPVREKASEGS